MKKYGRIIGKIKLGDSGYTKYSALVFSECGVHGIDEFLSDERHPYLLKDVVRYVWSKKHDRIQQYPVNEEEKFLAEGLYWRNARLLWQEEMHN